MSMAYIRKYYGVPAKRGARVEYSGGGFTQQGTISSSRGQYILVRFSGVNGPLALHPTWQVRYLDATLCSPAVGGGSRDPGGAKVCLYLNGCPPDGPVCHLCAHVQPAGAA